MKRAQGFVLVWVTLYKFKCASARVILGGFVRHLICMSFNFVLGLLFYFMFWLLTRGNSFLW